MLIHIHTPQRTRTIDTSRVRQLDALTTALTRRVLDAEFEEGEHPRAPDGKFTSGGGTGPKPTTHTAKSIKGGLHQLLSTGHPFSIKELQDATGVKSPAMMAAYLSDLKNPKYAPKEGHLAVVKRSDGLYHVAQEAGGPTPEQQVAMRSLRKAIKKEESKPAALKSPPDVTSPTILRVTRDPLEGTQHWVKLPGDDREFPLVRGDATMGLGTVWTPGVGGAWDDYAAGPAPSQNGYISQSTLGDTKEEALRNLPDLVKRLDASPHYSSKAKLDHDREHQKGKTYRNLTTAPETIDDPKLKDRLDDIIDSARVNADDTVDVEKEAKPNEWDSIFKGTVESILSSGETNHRVHEFFKTHSKPADKVQFKSPGEYVMSKEKAVGSKHLYHEGTGAKAKMTEYPDHMHLTGVATPKEGRGQGGARDIMRQALAHADSKGLPTVLHAIPDEDKDEARLIDFYKQHGFVQGKGGMIRYPQKSTTERAKTREPVKQADPTSVLETHVEQTDNGPSVHTNNIFKQQWDDMPLGVGVPGFQPHDKEVSLSELVPTQSHVTVKGVKGYQASGEQRDKHSGMLPEAIKKGDKYYLLDGHHRVAAQMLGGSNKFKIHVMSEKPAPGAKKAPEAPKLEWNKSTDWQQRETAKLSTGHVAARNQRDNGDTHYSVTKPGEQDKHFIHADSDGNVLVHRLTTPVDANNLDKGTSTKGLNPNQAAKFKAIHQALGVTFANAKD